MAKAWTALGWRQPLCSMSGYGSSLGKDTVSPTSRPLSWEVCVHGGGGRERKERERVGGGENSFAVCEGRKRNLTPA